jgi:hypothetical protein
MALYGYPAIGRFGLGHSLLAWARCVIWCEQTGAKMLAPIWLRPRIGPYLRNERDKREYFKLFHSGAAIDFPKRELLLLASKKIRCVDGFFSDDIFDEQFVDSHKNSRLPVVVQFENSIADNESKHFDEVLGHHALLKRNLLTITRRRYQPVGFAVGKIAIHVRLGDFEQPEIGDEITTNRRLPIEWYCEALQMLRTQLAADVPAVIFSDGSDADLKPLLAYASVERAPKNEAVTDMLSISEAGVLIASVSGFSHWGAFLGQVPTIHRRGRRPQTFIGVDKEVEWAIGDKFPPTFLNICRRHLADV